MDTKVILEKINTSSLKFLEPLTPEETYATIVKEATALVNAKYGSLILQNEDDFKRVYSTLPSVKMSPIRRNGFTYKAFIEKKAFVIHADDPDTFHKEIIKLGIKSTLFVPVSYKSKSVGVLVMNSASDQHFTDRHLKILELFGSMVSLAIRKMQLYEEAKQALETRDTFIALAAHELRTPLTSVNGYAQLLYSKLSKLDSAEGRWSRELFHECHRLTKLSTELLTVNLVRSDQLEFTWQECNMESLILDVIEEFQLHNTKHPVKIRNGLLPSQSIVIGDSAKLTQVIANILDNAAKFSAEGTEILITFKKRSQNLIIQIEDHGSGINKKDLDKIFDGFYKGFNNFNSGLGIGLFLANYIVKRHHGEIKVKSIVKKGTKIEIILPRMRP